MIKQIPIHLIRPSETLRSAKRISSGYLATCRRDLAIREPSFVTPAETPDKPYRLVSNPRPWYAAQQLMFDKIPAVVLPTEFSDYKPHSAETIDPVTQAEYMHHELTLSGVTQERFAALHQISRTTLNNQLRLLKLIEPIQQLLKTGEISIGVAKQILSLRSAKAQQRFLERHYRQNMTVEETQRVVRRMTRSRRSKTPDKNLNKTTDTTTTEPENGPDSAKRVSADQMEYGEKFDDPNTKALVKQLSEYLGNQVDLTSSHVIISYGKDYDILDGILDKIGFKP